MITLKSSSPLEEQLAMVMDDTTNNSNNKKRLVGEINNGKVGGGGDDDDDNEEEEECDVEVWDMLSKNFKLVQAVLEQNKNLIQQANDNQQSKIPDNLTKNVSLIREINENISKVISIYSELWVNFSSVVQERRRIKQFADDRLLNFE